MKNMYAVKCLYKYSYYNQENELIEEVIPSWEERIILIKADNMDDVDKKSIIFAKEYENEYINVNNHIFNKQEICENVESDNVGALIGMLERAVILLLGALGLYSSIALVLTAKSLARFKQLEKKILLKNI